ncbi:helix-turn-helix domain-containing protein [Cohnella ginsengisoli]|uniref:Helix-turn-helix domain-containing protein n=1 Tax=Cohnella ginsengisoli TaxID=425004 RepID=A0A9X4KHM6_9BACL|nr:helix-turn-helix domain-containing protein [Cohnella ginsengisoli]MDG0789810.1 helix-turn-helix domain-containing protein [Cohnella ginsengisoli]
MTPMSRKDAHLDSRPTRVSFPIMEPKEDFLEMAVEARLAPNRSQAEDYGQLVELQSAIGRVSRLLLEGGSLEQALDTMEEALGNPIAVFGSRGGEWRSSCLRLPDASPSFAAVAAQVRRGGERASVSSFVGTDGGRRAYVHRIAKSGDPATAIALFEHNRPVTALDMLTLARLSAFVDLEMANIDAVREVEGKYLELFLQDWLSGKIVSELDWTMRAEVCGCEIKRPGWLYAAVIGWEEAGAGGDAPDGTLADLSRRLRSGRRLPGRELLSAVFGGDLVLILTGDDGEGRDLAEAAGEASLRELLEELRAELAMPAIRLFAGRPVAKPELLPASLSQAKRAKRVAEVCGLAGDVVSYDNLGVYALLYLIPGGEEREQFLRRYMVPLQQADRKGGGRLAETLEMFFRCNGNIKLTSEKLYAHYNTIVYRLDKIQSILGVSLDDPEDRLQLQLSLKLGQISPGSY